MVRLLRYSRWNIGSAVYRHNILLRSIKIVYLTIFSRDSRQEANDIRVGTGLCGDIGNKQVVIIKEKLRAS